MKMLCENALSLVPSYLDGELSEEQAAPLRTHLFDCPSCREVAKQETALKRWFESAKTDSESPGRVPTGFAARVARRAFAGDPGVLTPYRREDAGVAAEDSTLPFVLKLCALAAGLLFVFSIAIQRESLPQGNGLGAEGWEDLPAEWLDEEPGTVEPDETPEGEDE